MSNPNEQQIGGEHYKKYAIQPWDYIMKNNIPWAEGCIIEWVTRWRDKGGVQDLEKAKHMIDKILSHCPTGRHSIGYDPPCDCERCSAE